MSDPLWLRFVSGPDIDALGLTPDDVVAAAGEVDQAIPFSLAAARAAVRLGAFADVLRHVEPLLAHRPLLPEALDKVVRELPRDAAAIGIFNKLAGGDPLPVR